MGISIATAPCCWGVDDIRNPNLPSWERVFDEAAAAGYSGLELGPYGYVPLDLERVRAALAARGLGIVAGTIFDDLASPANRNNLLQQTDDICALISGLPRIAPLARRRFAPPYLTIMDWGHDERDFASGHSERAPRLSNSAWAGMVANIEAIADLARTYGVRAVIHPHAGGYIEFADEISRIAADIPPDAAGFCIDTGHTLYAGMDPVRTLDQYAGRIDYVHFKDIDARVLADVMGRRIRFFEACGEGVMCPIGRGMIDYPAIRLALARIDYQGVITVEQERDPRDAGGSLADVKASRDYLRSVGF
jgi:inosose dehydratase